MKPLSRRSSLLSVRLAACAGVVALGVLTLGGCSAATSGPDYHSDIDHNGQPFDGFDLGNSGDAKSGEVKCDKNCDKACCRDKNE